MQEHDGVSNPAGVTSVGSSPEESSIRVNLGRVNLQTKHLQQKRVTFVQLVAVAPYLKLGSITVAQVFTVP